MGKFSDIEDLHVSMKSLKNCASVRNMNDLFRVVPPRLTTSGAALIDAQMEQCVRKISGGVLEHDAFLKLNLTILSRNQRFEIGLYAAFCTAAHSFIASSALSRQIIRASLTSAGLSPNANKISAAHNFWKNKNFPADDPGLDVIMSPSCPQQRSFTRLVFRKVQADLPEGDYRTKAFRASLGVPGDKDWIKFQPSPGIKAYITDRDFRV